MVTTPQRYRIARTSAAVTAALVALILGGLVFLVLEEAWRLPGSLALVLVAFLVGYFFLMRKLRRRHRILQQPFPESWQRILETEVAFYRALPSGSQERFRKEVQLFLAEKRISGIELELNDQDRILVAASAVIPVFPFPDWEYDNLSEVLVYPGSFNDEFAVDGNDTNILGMVGIGSAMILSRPDLYRGFSRANDGQNVGFHEFLHKLDARDGEVDGIPAVLLDARRVDTWRQVLGKELERLRSGHSHLNPYGATNEAEFFAVAGEQFFEDPARLEQDHPDLYVMMREVFRQDTKEITRRVVAGLVRPKGRKIGRNDPCPCGSGRKYKHCCLEKKRSAG